MENIKGSNYDSSLTNKDIAKKLRAYIKKNYPDYKFSIRSDIYSIDVRLMSSKHDIFNHQLIKEYATKAQTPPFDEIPKYERYPRILQDVQNNSFNRQIGAYFDVRDLEYLNQEDAEALVNIRNYLQSFNYDNSDPYTDYFDVNFYTHFEIGQWDRPFSVA